MLAEVSAGLSSLKAAKDIIQGLNTIKTEAAINSVKIDLQSLILEAQQGLFAAQEAQTSSSARITQLEQQIVGLKDWSAERERYHLVDVYSGAFAYMPKPGMEAGQPAHWLCTNCFDQGRKSFLQFKGQGNNHSGSRGMQSTYGCDACKATILVSYRTNPAYPDATAE